MLLMYLLKCLDKYHETPESRELVDQKWDGDDSASPRITPRAPTPFKGHLRVHTEVTIT